MDTGHGIHWLRSADKTGETTVARSPVISDQYLQVSAERHLFISGGTIKKMDPVLLIGLDSGLDFNLIKILVDELTEPANNDLLITERGVRSRNANYAEVIVPLYTNNLFKEHFRMS